MTGAPPLAITDAILDAMDRYGGSFAKHLARLYRVGDPVNRAILASAFAPYFRKYADLVHDDAPRA